MVMVVVKDEERGCDLNENYTQVDNPFWDGTDGAHPAWWRGNDRGVQIMVNIINGWLDKPLDKMISGTYQKPIQDLRERIYQLRKQNENNQNSMG